MTPQLLTDIAIAPAMRMLPANMDSRQARVMMVAIAYQESALEYRQQVLRLGQHWWSWNGPARGWWQFESRGLRGVLGHRASATHAAIVMGDLGYSSPTNLMPAWLTSAHEALKHNDVLAAAIARLLLWTLPQALPTDADGGLAQYLDAWRPGAYTRGNADARERLRLKWTGNWNRAQQAVA